MSKNVDFLDKMRGFSVNKIAKYTFIAPFVIILIAAILILSLGLTGETKNDFAGAVGIGIDFEGGTIMYITLGDKALGDQYDINVKNIKKAIQEEGVKVSYVQRQEASDTSKTTILFRYKNKTGEGDEAIAARNKVIEEKIKNMYPELGTNFVHSESIGATAASDLLSKAAIAISVSTLLILIYIMIRFTFISGVAAVFALLHDVIIMFCLTVICRIQINTSFVAAVITIIAYSINNTIIIFDRCRESLKPLKNQQYKDYKTIGDEAVRKTLTRSIYTTITTMVTIILLAILGSETLREFCVPIILGLIAGLYSSIFLAVPMWAGMSASFDKTVAKYKARHEVQYDEDGKAIEAENKDSGKKKLFAKKEKANKNVEQIETTEEIREKKVKDKKKAKINTVHKYSKKNTTFKKK